MVMMENFEFKFEVKLVPGMEYLLVNISRVDSMCELAKVWVEVSIEVLVLDLVELIMAK